MSTKEEGEDEDQDKEIESDEEDLMPLSELMKKGVASKMASSDPDDFSEDED